MTASIRRVGAPFYARPRLRTGPDPCPALRSAPARAGVLRVLRPCRVGPVAVVRVSASPGARVVGWCRGELGSGAGGAGPPGWGWVRVPSYLLIFIKALLSRAFSVFRMAPP
ncbi:hypothetical protein GCM10010347_44790 [Streptomyces cirratus]|uniref:Uncharacterized protein n=1 Tax=Streptomyces cirratus TaxID=68187 RepID=A0ABQ3F1A2_9ACTN|nr:hypothetical protein GCM10010347_44790 [Streptomyces cirratus]